MTDLRVFPDLDHLSAGLANDMVEILEKELQTNGRALNVAISGGNTPLGMLAHLRGDHANLDLWKHLQLFWVDERYVPFDDHQSNYGNARPYIEALGIPESQIHPMKPGFSPAHAAQEYDQLIENLYTGLAQDQPLFDLTLLGLGTDGHVASLFPGMNHYLDRNFCKASFHPQTGQERISLTVAALNRSHHVIFMASGSSKAEIVKQVYHAQPEPRIPATLIQPTQMPIWYLDQQAAILLT